MEYSHEQAVADGVNIEFDVCRIRTAISEHGSTVNAGFYVDKRAPHTRKVRWEQLGEDLAYGANQPDRDVATPDQIRTVIRTFKERLFTEIFPGRTEVPKTLIFAKDDSHADDIVQIVREEFGKGNDFCQKITCRTSVVRVMNKERAMPLRDELSLYSKASIPTRAGAGKTTSTEFWAIASPNQGFLPPR